MMVFYVIFHRDNGSSGGGERSLIKKDQTLAPCTF